MTIESILALIEQARRQEASRGRFRQQMTQKLKEFHLAIRIDAPDRVDCLVHFVEDYIEMAPRLIQCIETTARKIQREQLFAPLLEEVLEGFERPAHSLARFDGLDGLLIKAYLCHRLIEELYENNRSIRNFDLMNTQVLEANLLTHHLIGEPFANELDSSTLLTARTLTSSQSYYELNLTSFALAFREAKGAWIQDRWGSLLTRNHIAFCFSYRTPLG